MLSLLLRGFFLIGVVSWYSMGLWKMIDGYFKDQFQRYLLEEYQKNPKMRADVEAYKTAGKTDPDSGSATLPTVNKVAAVSRGIYESSIGMEETLAESGSARNDASSENGVANASSDKNAVPEMTSGPPRQAEEEKPDDDDKNIPNSFARSEDEEVSEHSERSRRDQETSEPSEPEETVPESRFQIKTATRKKKRNVESTKKHRLILSNDFSNFDAEEDDPKGILVSELPFKPRADIGNLKRVSAEEYCPLSFEDKGKCGEITEWP